jgi:hypothetical protein
MVNRSVPSLMSTKGSGGGWYVVLEEMIGVGSLHLRTVGLFPIVSGVLNYRYSPLISGRPVAEEGSYHVGAFAGPSAYYFEVSQLLSAIVTFMSMLLVHLRIAGGAWDWLRRMLAVAAAAAREYLLVHLWCRC